MILTTTWGPPSGADGWRLGPHPESPHPVSVIGAGAPAPAAPPPGRGTVVLRVGCVDPKRPGMGGGRPQTPVVLVDSAPVTQGWGEAAIALPPGRHVLEVQAGVSRLSRVVDVTEGATIALDYLNALPQRMDKGERDAALGPRDTVRLPLQVRNRMSWTAVGAFIAAGVLGMPLTMLLRGSDGYGTSILAVTLLMVAAPVVAIVAGVIAGRKARRAAGAAPAPVEVSGRELLLCDGSADDPGVPGATGILLRTRFWIAAGEGRQRLEELIGAGAGGRDAVRLAGKVLSLGEPAPLPHRPWVPPVLAAVDAENHTLPWGAWLIPAAPGPHRVVVETPRPSQRLTDPGTSFDTGPGRVEHTVTVEPGRVAVLDYYAVVTMDVRGEGPVLDRYAVLALDEPPA